MPIGVNQDQFGLNILSRVNTKRKWPIQWRMYIQSFPRESFDILRIFIGQSNIRILPSVATDGPPHKYRASPYFSFRSFRCDEHSYIVICLFLLTLVVPSRPGDLVVSDPKGRQREKLNNFFFLNFFLYNSFRYIFFRFIHTNIMPIWVNQDQFRMNILSRVNRKRKWPIQWRMYIQSLPRESLDSLRIFIGQSNIRILPSVATDGPPHKYRASPYFSFRSFRCNEHLYIVICLFLICLVVPSRSGDLVVSDPKGRQREKLNFFV